jgi:hypothetical protein
LASLCLDLVLRTAQFIAIYFEAKRTSAKKEEEKKTLQICMQIVAQEKTHP